MDVVKQKAVYELEEVERQILSASLFFGLLLPYAA